MKILNWKVTIILYMTVIKNTLLLNKMLIWRTCCLFQEYGKYFIFVEFIFNKKEKYLKNIFYSWWNFSLSLANVISFTENSLCTNPRPLSTYYTTNHFCVVLEAQFTGLSKLLYNYLCWETGMVWWHSSD